MPPTTRNSAAPLTRLLTWRGLDFPRMELAEVELGPGGLAARGVQIGTLGEDGFVVRYPGLGERL